MASKSLCLVLILFFAEEFTFQNGDSAIVYEPVVVRPVVPVLHVAELKSIFDTDKPDAELGNKLVKLGNEIQPYIPWGRSFLRKLTANVNWLESIHPRIVNAGLRLKDGRSNPTFRTSISEEMANIAEYYSQIAAEMKQLLDDGQKYTEIFKTVSEELKEKQKVDKDD